jgi:hypothetical protein
MHFCPFYILRMYIEIDVCGPFDLCLFRLGISICHRNTPSKSGLLSWTYQPDGASPAFANSPSVAWNLPVPTIDFSWPANLASIIGYSPLFQICARGHSHSALTRLVSWISRTSYSLGPCGKGSDHVHSLSTLRKLGVVSMRGRKENPGVESNPRRAHLHRSCRAHLHRPCPQPCRALQMQWDGVAYLSENIKPKTLVTNNAMLSSKPLRTVPIESLSLSLFQGASECCCKVSCAAGLSTTLYAMFLSLRLG